jgi:hypothetical protein
VAKEERGGMIAARRGAVVFFVVIRVAARQDRGVRLGEG